MLMIVQRDATQSSLFIILHVHSTCFGCQPHPSSGVHKTVTTASGTGHIFRAATTLQRGQRCGRHPKHVENTLDTLGTTIPSQLMPYTSYKTSMNTAR